MLGERARHGPAAADEARRAAEQVAEAVEAGGAAGSCASSGVTRRRARSRREPDGAARARSSASPGVAGAGHHDGARARERPAAARRRARSLLPGGRPVPRGLRGAIGAGVALVSGDRRRFGLMLDKPLWENIGQVRAVALAADGPLVARGACARTRATRSKA